jgi:hypothetical protein
MELYMMKFLKPVAIGACALVALAVGVSSATAGAPTKTKANTTLTAGSCDGGTPGKAAIAAGVARLKVPEQMSWAKVTAYQNQELKLEELTTLKFDSNASDPGVVWAKITTDQGNVLYSPNTQPGGETGVGAIATHDVLDGTVRYNDDAGFDADVSWDELLAEAGTDKVKSVSVTAGCANPVGADGAQVQVDNLNINGQVNAFN